MCVVRMISVVLFFSQCCKGVYVSPTPISVVRNVYSVSVCVPPLPRQKQQQIQAVWDWVKFVKAPLSVDVCCAYVYSACLCLCVKKRKDMFMVYVLCSLLTLTVRMYV